jgi:hypothetical protein
MYDFISTFEPHLNQKLIDEVAGIADHEARARRTRQLIESLQHI